MLLKRKVDQKQFDDYKEMQKREHNLTRWVVGIGAAFYLGISALLYNASVNQIQAYKAETKALIEANRRETKAVLDAHNERIKQNEEMIKIMYSYCLGGGKK